MNKVTRKSWSVEDDQVLIDNYKTHTYEDIAELLVGRTSNAIRLRLKKLGLNKYEKWLEEEDSYVLKHYGKVPLSVMSKKLNKSILSIQRRMYKLEGTTSAYEYTGYYSTVDIAEIMGLTTTAIQLFIKNKEFTAVRSGKRQYLISDEVFWKWLELNTHRIKAKKVPDYVLLSSPSWYPKEVNALIKKENNKELKGVKLTQYEKTLAWNMFLSGKKITEISSELGRQYVTIQKMIRTKKSKIKDKKAS